MPWIVISWIVLYQMLTNLYNPSDNFRDRISQIERIRISFWKVLEEHLYDKDAVLCAFVGYLLRVS